ncbi:type VI secretion system Vgr family protein [Piscinibacter sp. HJYY11]|uniref:type VI secretion system Vgr family protein n=1 Tax=Piscinibacter sp. HJYY11 TaxID=2801333 RepID=UPI00191E265D|nr:type VI secretion system Vgr family protein [Piscinibacter sp. HJYY11]MBL0726141.1 type VI secretion system tip protein VgrG [Piscinibacter sp. HJYY11]
MMDRLSDAMSGAAGRMLSGFDSALSALLASWTSAQRLYNLEGAAPVSDLMVERFSVVDTISEPFQLQLHTLCVHNRTPLQALLGQRITLLSTLADGSRHRRSGLVFEARDAGADGGLVRHQLLIQPWLALLGHTRNSRVWQDKTIVQILDDVLGADAYKAHAAWQWGETDAEGNTEDLAAFVAQGLNGGVRAYCVQYRESDLAFLQRLLAEEGLGWRVEEADDAPSGHRIVFFADSARWPENTTSRSALGGAGIRFHRGSAAEEQDAIQSFGGWRQLTPAASAVLQWDYQAKRAIAAESPTAYDYTSESMRDMAPWLQQYEPIGATADTGTCSSAELQHRATCRQQAHEARHKTWLGRSTVRSLRAGEHFGLTQSTLDALSELQSAADREFCVRSVHALGVNNLPKELSKRLMQQPASDPFAELDGEPASTLSESLEHDPALSRKAAELGYANRFEALRRLIPWRPLPPTTRTALGAQTAIVVGPGGATSPNGADELYTDALGRIRVQFHWQSAPGADARPDNRSSCWVRVAQRWAGAGMGWQHIPRIGQEVLLDFIEGDIERPIVLGSLYNGRGEAGLPPTPGGAAAEADTSAYKSSHNHGPSAQGNLVGGGSGGHSPAWHGGAPGPAGKDAAAQNNTAALSGFKSKEFGGEGFNQLVFDDTPGELRVQLATTQHATQLNLGHLIHQADNHRGHYRGRGFELRTDAYGAVRATNGLLITTFGTREADPAGDNAPGMALLKQAATLADTFSKAAKTHQTTALASAIGAMRANQSSLADQLAPMKALHQSVSGMVSAASLEQAITDASNKATQASDGKLPHTTDPIVAITAKAGLATVAGQDIQVASGEVISWQAGQDIHLGSGQQMRVHTGQSIGILAGAVQAGQGAKGTGLTLIAGKGPVQMQAQADQAEVAAKNLVNIQTANAHIDWAAAKKITLTTSGGAQIVLSGEGITVQCPGKITVKAASKSFVGGAKEDYVLPVMPKDDISWVNLEGRYEDAWNTAWPLDGLKVDINGSTVAKSVTVDMTQEIA